MAKIEITVNSEMDGLSKKNYLQTISKLDADVLRFLADKTTAKGANASTHFRNVIKNFGRML